MAAERAQHRYDVDEMQRQIVGLLRQLAEQNLEIAKLKRDPRLVSAPSPSAIRHLVSVENPKQWRIENARYLKGVRLQLRRYTRWSETWDHDHCSACWATFAEFDGPDFHHEGYATCDDYKHGACYDWICRDCFEDLKDDLEWTTVPKPSSSTSS